ncbi:MAG: TlpA disulfide reductase family protein [Bacteroidota bacterium]
MTRPVLAGLLALLLAPAALAQADSAERSEVLRDLDARSERVEAARREALAATEGEPAEARQAALGAALTPFDLAADDARLAAAVEAETDPDVRQALLLSYVAVETDLADKNAALGMQALDAIGPAGALWSHRPALVKRALALATLADPSAAAEAGRSIYEQHPDRAVQAYVLLHGLETAHAAQSEGRAQRYFDLLQTDRFYETEPGLIAWGVFQRYATRVRPGAPVPEFAVPRLGGGALVSRASLLGSVYLVDFWAEWCLPCIREMPVLHAAYERFAGRGFEIVSVSMDDSPSIVEAFRAERFPMPWLHVWNGDGFGGGMAQAFEVRAVPKPILVGPDGTILITSSTNLRGANLERTLASLLGE